MSYLLVSHAFIENEYNDDAIKFFINYLVNNI